MRTHSRMRSTRRPGRARPRARRHPGGGPGRREVRVRRGNGRSRPPDAARPRHRRAAAALPAAAPPRRRRVVPAVQRARRRLRPRRPARPAPCATATSGWSTARRCGRRARTTPTSAILLARTDPDAPEAPRHHRTSSSTCTPPGVDVRPLRQIDGAARLQRGVPQRRPGPADNVVGEVNGGWAVARTTLANESALIGEGGRRARAPNSRCSWSWRDRLRATARVRQASPTPKPAPILRHVGERAQAAGALEVDTRIRAARCSSSSGPTPGPGRSRPGRDPGRGRDARRRPDDGYWQGQVLRQFHWRIGGGTDEIHRTMIGERVLGLPPEPRVDRDVPFREQTK